MSQDNNPYSSESYSNFSDDHKFDSYSGYSPDTSAAFQSQYSTTGFDNFNNTSENYTSSSSQNINRNQAKQANQLPKQSNKKVMSYALRPFKYTLTQEQTTSGKTYSGSDQITPENNQPITTTNNISSSFQNQNNNRLASFTMRQILQLPLTRQQYLSHLSIPQITQQIQFQYLKQSHDQMLAILNHYQKYLTDQQIKKQLKSIHNRKQLNNILYFTSLLVWILSADKIQKRYPTIYSLSTKKWSLIVPVTLTFMSMWHATNTSNRIVEMIDRPSNNFQLGIAVKKYLCETNSSKRRHIIGWEDQDNDSVQQGGNGENNGDDKNHQEIMQTIEFASDIGQHLKDMAGNE